MLPEWLTIRPASTERYARIKEEVGSMGLHTVCVDAHCPNMAECWSGGTATFMVLGGTCTRGCRFCAVPKGARGDVMDADEPAKLGRLMSDWKLGYAVITSVCRDDLPDQGAGHFSDCVREIKKASPKTVVEVLIPDFGNDPSLLEMIADAKPDVVGHNIETVERISPLVRDRRAQYGKSLAVLRAFKKIDSSIYTKSALMLGLGETEEEVLAALSDLRAEKVDFVAMGQYLRPSKAQAEVNEYVTPERFGWYREKAMAMGFSYAAAGPFVRSSYRAGENFIESAVRRKK